MSQKLPVSNDEILKQAFRIIEQMDSKNRKVGMDVEIGMNRLILTSPNGTRYSVTVSNAGLLSTVPV